MPWKEIGEVPDSVKTHQGASLTIEQANRWAELRDGIASGDNPPDSPEAVAWTQWEKEHKLSDDKKTWVKEQTKEAAARKAFASRMLDSQGIIVAVHLHRETLAVDDDLLWVEACMTLDFQDEASRHVTITRNDLESLVRNFESDVVGRKVFVDIDHMAEFAASDDPISRARIGTVEKVKLGISKNPETKGETVLLCGVRLNKRGKEAVEGEEFGYISAVIHSKWKDRRVDHQDEFVKGKVLTSITLTNDPFVPWLAEVGSDVADKVAASRALLIRMVDADKVERFVLSLGDGESMNDLRNRLQAALHKKLGLADDQYIWAEDVQVIDETKGMVVFRFKDVLQGCDYVVDANGAITLDAEVYEIKTSWEKIPKADKPLRRQGDSDMDEKEREALVRERDETKLKLKEAEDKLALSAKAEKENKETVERLRRDTLVSKFNPILAALKEPNKAKRLIPPAILDRVEKLAKLVLTGEGEATALKEATTALEGSTPTLADAAKGFMAELSNQVGSESEAVALSKVLLVEFANLLGKFKETETVEPEAQTRTPSEKPPDKDKPRGTLISERFKEILGRKPEDVPELLSRKLKPGTDKYITEALKLAETQLIAEGVIEKGG